MFMDCCVCGDSFRVTPSKIAKGAKYCSRDCQFAAFRKSKEIIEVIDKEDNAIKKWAKPLPLFGNPK